MSDSRDLLDQAKHLANKESKKPKQASLRRAVSASYYALFHHLTWEAVELVSGYADAAARAVMERWLDHRSMYNACGIFAAPLITGPLSKLTGTSPMPELQTVARSFCQLQQARHTADYDMTSHWTRLGTEQSIQLAGDAIQTWNKVRKKPQASIFALTLLDQKRVQSER